MDRKLERMKLKRNKPDVPHKTNNEFIENHI